MGLNLVVIRLTRVRKYTTNKKNTSRREKQSYTTLNSTNVKSDVPINIEQLRKSNRIETKVFNS